MNPRSGASPPRRPADDGPYRVAAVMVALAGGLGFILLLVQFRLAQVLLLIFAGILLGVLLRTLSEFVSQLTKLRRGWSLVVVVIALLGLGALGIWLLAPHLTAQFAQLAQQLPQSLAKLRARLEQYSWSRYVLEKVGSPEQALAEQSSWFIRATGFASTTIDILLQLIVVIFVGLYIAGDPREYRDGLLRLVPCAYRPRAREVLHAVGYSLRWWLIGQGITMIVIGTLTWFGLWMLGIPLSLPLGILAGLFNFIPNFGPLVSFTPAVLLALAISPEKALHVFLLYIAAQGFEGYILTPMVQRRAAELPPAVTIIVQVLMGWLVGALGVMLAAPLTATVIVLVKMFYVEDTLGDEIAVAGEAEAKARTAQQKAGAEEPPRPSS